MPNSLKFLFVSFFLIGLVLWIMVLFNTANAGMGIGGLKTSTTMCRPSPKFGNHFMMKFKPNIKNKISVQKPKQIKFNIRREVN